MRQILVKGVREVVARAGGEHRIEIVGLGLQRIRSWSFRVGITKISLEATRFEQVRTCKRGPLNLMDSSLLLRSGSRLAVDYDLLSSSPEVTQLNLVSAHLSITCGLRDDEC